MLAAFYLLLHALDQGSRVLVILAIFCEYMSLWSYESPIVIILLAPLLLLWLRGDMVRKRWVAIAGWYAVLVVYLMMTAVRYLRPGGHTYQQSVLRKDWSIVPILGDWLFNIGASLLLDSARSLWRTHMLSSIGAALLLSTLVAICASAVQSRWLRFGLLPALSAGVVWCGSYSALAKSANHRWLWDRHKQAMQEVLEVAPRVKPGTLILLTNVPGGEADPFGGDNMWFDLALRLAYPGTQVAGVYWHHDGTPARGRRPRVDSSGRWSLRANPLVHEGGADSILAIQYSDDGHASAAPRLPQFLGFGERASSLYNPTARIETVHRQSLQYVAMDCQHDDPQRRDRCRLGETLMVPRVRA